MKRSTLVAALLAALATVLVLAALAPTGSAKVTNENTDDLPPGCEELQGERSLTVHAGRMHAEQFNGVVFTFDERSWEIDPCTKVTVTFVNEDEIRHQFMVHGTYPFDPGFFQIEVTGPGQDTGTYITGADPATKLVHCGVRQHQQRGMKAQVLVGGGEGDLPNVPGISGLPPGAEPASHSHDDTNEADGEDEDRLPTPALGAEVALLVAAAGLLAHRRRRTG